MLCHVSFRGYVKLGGGFKYCLFSPRKIGEASHFDDHIFQRGWNHQLETIIFQPYPFWGAFAVSFREGIIWGPKRHPNTPFQKVFDRYLVGGPSTFSTGVWMSGWWGVAWWLFFWGGHSLGQNQGSWTCLTRHQNNPCKKPSVSPPTTADLQWILPWMSFNLRLGETPTPGALKCL